MAIAAACGFPNPPIESEEGGVSPDGSSDDANTDGSGDATPDTILGDEAFDGNIDAFVVQDAGAKIDADGCDANAVCDCDKDGFHHVGTLVDGGLCDASVAQQNVDCDDYDTRYRPDQGYLAIPGEPPSWGDWNCNGEREKLVPRVTCTNFTALTTDCAKLQGFRDDPDCGTESPTYIFCKEGLVTCEEAANVEKRQQVCK